VPGRPDARAITLFESQGIASEDVAAAAFVYAEALRQGRVREI
jgi:ornithine cyclodeaminase/alanine dehydrogenase-like protein (mu-crystallin family)